jgi:hypothetical protein
MLDIPMGTGSPKAYSSALRHRCRLHWPPDITAADGGYRRASTWAADVNVATQIVDQDVGVGGLTDSASWARICWICASWANICAWICLASSNTAEASS